MPFNNDNKKKRNKNKNDNKKLINEKVLCNTLNDFKLKWQATILCTLRQYQEKLYNLIMWHRIIVANEWQANESKQQYFMFHSVAYSYEIKHARDKKKMKKRNLDEIEKRTKKGNIFRKTEESERYCSMKSFEKKHLLISVSWHWAFWCC